MLQCLAEYELCGYLEHNAFIDPRGVKRCALQDFLRLVQQVLSNCWRNIQCGQ